jgi:toxin ParE1/3/4
MSYHVVMIREAEEDICSIYRFIVKNDSINRAEQIFSSLQQTCLSLRHFPERGHTPPELDSVGIKKFKEIHFKPFRIIYEIEGKKVFVHCVVDGRQNMQELLEIRLLK